MPRKKRTLDIVLTRAGRKTAAGAAIPVVKKNGLAVFSPPPNFPRITAEDVKRALDGESGATA